MSCIKLPNLFQDHMMLQRDKSIHIWGEVTDPDVIRVLIRLQKDELECQVTDGTFSCCFPAQTAARDAVLCFYALKEGERRDMAADKEGTAAKAKADRMTGENPAAKAGAADSAPELVVHDILIGDIWMACGQSNMEYFLRYDAHWNDIKNAPHNSNIRMFNVPRLAYEGQRREQPECGFWFEEGDAAWPLFSAPGYTFARALQEDLEVPIGVIGCNWGGTPACAWMDEAHLQGEPFTVFWEEYEREIAGIPEEELKERSLEAIAFEDSYRHQLEWRTMMYGLTEAEQQLWMKEHAGDPEIPMGPYHHYRPAGLHHTMLRKVAPFSVKGFLWYQGESDSDHAEIYDQTMAALIDCFRETWQDEALPFLFVQLAPFGKWLDCTNENYAIVRQKQEYVSKHVPNTGMVSIMDFGSYEDIHPKFKREVGERLALLARGKVYGEQILCESPEFASVTRDGNELTMKFLYVGEGLYADARGAESFRVFQKNQPVLISSFASEGDTIRLITDADRDAPIEIRYADEDYCEVHIWSSIGLPVKPFVCAC